MYPYNPSNQLSQLLLQQAIQPQSAQTKVVEVTGRNGAEAFNLGPDSSILLLDNTAPIVWLVKTDGAGFKSLIPYDIKPHEEQKPIDQYKALEERITKLEDTINAKSNTSNVKRKSEPAE